MATIKFHPITLDHIPDPHLRGIGLVALAWSYMEGALERVIWRLSRLNDMRGRAFTTHMSLPARLDTLLALANHEFPKEKQTDRLKGIKEHILKTLSPKRNEIVHSRVIKFDEIEVAFLTHYKARGKIVTSVQQIDSHEYDSTAREILTTANELRGLLADYYDLIRKKDGAPPP
ncbi:MAG TPA: hypothetical protein VGZ89_03675 [Xanthobacteraceae bacterium]|jgi:hypothetical protein|nr:hypothetical protein [Xanthobacteraceae bacterium]